MALRAKGWKVLAGFKKFIMQGNVMDLAVGVIVGAAFSAVVKSLTDHILMPLIAAIFGQPNFDGNFVWHLGGGEIQFGSFLTAVVNFFIVAFALYFFLVLPMNKLRERHAKPAAEAPEDPQLILLKEIRDELRAKRD